MNNRVDMPALGENVTEATITRWLKQVGDPVAVDEPLLEVATDKVDTEIPAPFTGTLTDILAAENTTVAVGGPLATITGVQEPAPALPRTIPPPEPEPTPAPVGQEAVKMTRLRQTIARRMVESLRVAAQLTTVLEADVTAIARLRARHKHDFERRTGTKLSFLPFFAKAAVEALATHPMLNASVSEDSTQVTYHPARHLGIAVDSPRGLMVPVIRNADELSITGLATAIAEAAQRTRDNRISADELTGGTFTLTNTGSRGALFDTPIINQPQTGILGTGAVVERVVPIPDGDGGHAISVRSTVHLAITYDHRIVDGADAARFLSAIRQRLEGGFDDGDVH